MKAALPMLEEAIILPGGGGIHAPMPCIGRSHHASRHAHSRGTIDMAVAAIKGGAVDVIEKPIALQKLLQTVKGWVHAAPVPIERAAERALDRPAMAPLPAMPGGGARAAAGSTPRVQCFGLDRPLRAAREDFEKSYFEYHLAHKNGSMTRVAEKTGIVRTHLYRKLKLLGFDVLRTSRIEDMNEMAADRSSADQQS
ncbi:MAG: hypothetical protein M3R22_08105 [Pseudomonadota bacterium]|nr:hypothetical protein [Pseudomonadota bacterium]